MLRVNCYQSLCQRLLSWSLPYIIIRSHNSARPKMSFPYILPHNQLSKYFFVKYSRYVSSRYVASRTWECIRIAWRIYQNRSLSLSLNISHSAGPGWGQRTCFPLKFPGATEATGTRKIKRGFILCGIPEEERPVSQSLLRYLTWLQIDNSLCLSKAFAGPHSFPSTQRRLSSTAFLALFPFPYHLWGCFLVHQRICRLWGQNHL